MIEIKRYRADHLGGMLLFAFLSGFIGMALWFPQNWISRVIGTIIFFLCMFAVIYYEAKNTEYFKIQEGEE